MFCQCCPYQKRSLTFTFQIILWNSGEFGIFGILCNFTESFTLNPNARYILIVAILTSFILNIGRQRPKNDLRIDLMRFRLDQPSSSVFLHYIMQYSPILNRLSLIKPVVFRHFFDNFGDFMRRNVAWATEWIDFLFHLYSYSSVLYSLPHP